MGEVEGVDIVAEKVDVDVWPGNLHEHDATDAYYIGPFDDDQTCRDIPQLVLPWAGEKNHEEEPMHPLLQTGTLGGDGDSCQTSLGIDGGYESRATEGGEVNAKYMVKHPARLAVDQVDRPKHQFVNQFSDRPII